MEAEGVTSNQDSETMDTDAAAMEVSPLMILERKMKVARLETEKRDMTAVCREPWRGTR